MLSSEQSSATLANADSLLARLLMASNNSHNGNYMLANIQQSTPGVQCDTVSSLVGGTSNLLDLKLAQQQQQQQQQQNSASIQAHQSDDDEAAASSLHSAVLHQKYFANIESFVDIGVPKLVNKLTSLCQDAFDE